MYVIRLLDGQTLNMDHAATTIQEFMRYVRKEKFVTADTGAGPIGISTRGVATVQVARRRAEVLEEATPDLLEKVRTVG
jgi:hypothetical protein